MQKLTKHLHKTQMHLFSWLMPFPTFSQDDLPTGLTPTACALWKISGKQAADHAQQTLQHFHSANILLMKSLLVHKGLGDPKSQELRAQDEIWDHHSGAGLA